jgi:hypothetical protein
VFVNPGESGRGMRTQRGCRLCPLLFYRHGSASELEYHVLLARDLKLIKPMDYEQLVQGTTEVKRMLTVLIQKLKADR